MCFPVLHNSLSLADNELENAVLKYTEPAYDAISDSSSIHAAQSKTITISHFLGGRPSPAARYEQ